jgi:hypothetical protein
MLLDKDPHSLYGSGSPNDAEPCGSKSTKLPFSVQKKELAPSRDKRKQIAYHLEKEIKFAIEPILSALSVKIQKFYKLNVTTNSKSFITVPSSSGT